MEGYTMSETLLHHKRGCDPQIGKIGYKNRQGNRCGLIICAHAPRIWKYIYNGGGVPPRKENRLIHPSLPRLVKQRYGTELRSRTLASIKPEISQALSSLLEEIRTSDDAKILRSAVSNTYQWKPATSHNNQWKPAPNSKTTSRKPRSSKVCPLCSQANRSDTHHFLSECKFLPDSDRRYMIKARQIADIFDDNDSELETHAQMPSTESIDPPAHTAHDAVVLRIQTRQSPYLDVFYNHHTVRMTVDSDVEVLAGTPFMEKNDIAVRPAKGQIILGDNTIYTYGAHHSTLTSTTARLVTVLRAPPRNATVWPGEFLEITLPDDTPTDAEYALEPRTDAPSARRVKPSAVWPPPGIVTSIAGRIRIPNLTSEPRSLKRNEHFCQVRQLFEPSNVTTTSPARAFPSTDTLHSANVSLDPDSLLPSDIKAKFKALHHEYDQVFDANIEGYNGHVGPFEARVNMGPVEPP
ncbi:predicted protein [Nematostella vectensis]|uniref:Uncharacterized protein n=1 Tax=Nematostella vectensis TaxID=45351 RepID=A7RNI3_NEMVE|nr:predicted protein [Nematostella vectensis]|eukprot:XP_001638991.1 predicted protein [Nematostella vectensis]